MKDMTNGEAIEKIVGLKRYLLIHGWQDFTELDLAIAALKYDERTRGEWIDHSKDGEWYGYQCSCCGTLFRREMYMKGYPYCPRCNSFMPEYDFKWRDNPNE